jgi:hypothetical protein
MKYYQLLLPQLTPFETKSIIDKRFGLNLKS